MTIAEARTLVRQFARNAGDSTMYADADVDRAMQWIGNQFCRVTRCIKLRTGAALSSGDVSVSAFIPCAPERVLSANVLADTAEAVPTPVSIVSWDELIDLRADGATGVPTHMAFELATLIDGEGVASIYPTADANYTLYVYYWDLFSSWTAGVSGSGSAVDLNLPDDYLLQFLPCGATWRLQFNEPEHKYGADARVEYYEAEKRFMGAGGTGEKSVRRMSLRDLSRARRWACDD